MNEHADALEHSIEAQREQMVTHRVWVKVEFADGCKRSVLVELTVNKFHGPPIEIGRQRVRTSP